MVVSMDLEVAIWNIRGGNNPAKRQALNIFFQDLRCNIVCLQETKIETMTSGLVSEMLGPKFGHNFICLPAVGSRGGILIACTDDFDITLDATTPAQFSVSGHITHKSDLTS